MNIATLGVAIDPSAAESGARRAKAAAATVEQALDKTGTAAAKAQKGMDDSAAKMGGAFSRMVTNAGRAANAVINSFHGIGRGAFGMVRNVTDALGKVGLAIDGLNKISMPLRGFATGIFGKASEMEDFKYKWAYILGSFDKAREKMADLAKFANTTPFDLPGVTQAALKMSGIKDAALKGMEGIKLVGDAAAKAGQPIEDVAERITRLVSSLKAGTGGGEPLSMLREWRVISAETGMKISALADDPKNYAAALKLVVEEMKKADDSMKLASTSWSGLTSTLGDAWGALQTAIGEPLLEGLKPLLVNGIDAVDGMTARIKEWAPEIKQFGVYLTAGFKAATGEGGLMLMMGAASDYATEQLKRGFQIAGKLLENAFDVVTHKFTTALERLASREFWVHVGEALVEGVGKAFKAMADWGTAGLGGQNIRDLVNNAVTGTKPGSGTVLAPPMPAGPQWMTPGEAEASVPYNEPASVTEWKRLMDSKLSETTSIADRLEAEANTIVNAQGPGGPSAELFPGGNTIDLTGGGVDLAGTQDMIKATEELDRIQDKYVAGVKEARFEHGLMAAQAVTEHTKLIQGWTDMAKQTEEFTANAAKAITGGVGAALTDIVSGTKSAKEAFADMSKAIVNDILKMTMNMLVQITYAKILGWVTGVPTGTVTSMVGAFGGGTTFARTNHTGGEAGTGAGRSVPSSMFAGASRYHAGGTIGGDEVPTILQKGETVLTRDEARGIRDRISGSDDKKGSGGVTIINVIDPNMVPDYHAQNPDAILNIISPRMNQVRQLMNSRKA